MIFDFARLIISAVMGFVVTWVVGQSLIKRTKKQPKILDGDPVRIAELEYELGMSPEGALAQAQQAEKDINAELNPGKTEDDFYTIEYDSFLRRGQLEKQLQEQIKAREDRDKARQSVLENDPTIWEYYSYGSWTPVSAYQKYLIEKYRFRGIEYKFRVKDVSKSKYDKAKWNHTYLAYSRQTADIEQIMKEAWGHEGK